MCKIFKKQCSIKYISSSRVPPGSENWE